MLARRELKSNLVDRDLAWQTIVDDRLDDRPILVDRNGTALVLKADGEDWKGYGGKVLVETARQRCDVGDEGGRIVRVERPGRTRRVEAGPEKGQRAEQPIVGQLELALQVDARTEQRRLDPRPVRVDVVRRKLRVEALRRVGLAARSAMSAPQEIARTHCSRAARHVRSLTANRLRPQAMYASIARRAALV